MLFELIRRGVQHEHTTHRAPLPRRLMVYKDESTEGKGRDVIAVTKLREALTTASLTQFDGGLTVDSCETLNSENQPLIQLADLYTGCINRTIVRPRSSPDNPKDVFADYMLEKIREREPTEVHERAEVDDVGGLETQMLL